MRGYKPVGLAERQNAAIAARKAALEHFRSTAAANEAGFHERQQALKGVRLARETRAAARQALRETEEAASVARKRETALAAERDADRDRIEQAARKTTLAAEQKAARDARYAARKARR